MIDKLLDGKYHAIRKSVRDFCEREVKPVAAEIDKEASFPWEIVEKMAKLNYFGIQTPKELGGSGMDTLGYTIVVEEIARAAGGLGLCVTVHNSVAVYPIMAFGNDEQKKKFVPPLAKGEKIGAFCLTEPNAGSDASGIEATAISDGDHYIVNANKVFVTNGGVADTCLFFVRTDPDAGRRGISVLIVERGTPGFVAGELEDMSGMRCNQVSSLRLYDCKVPKENLLGREGMGLLIGLNALDVGRMGIAAQAVGIAQAAFEEATKYSMQRKQFNTPIANHQAIQMMLADMATQVEAARALVQRAASMRDKGLPFSKEAAMAKLFASETSSRVADMAVQVHGGYGYSKSYPVERYYRDARVTRIYEGTAEIHRIVIAKNVLDEME